MAKINRKYIFFFDRFQKAVNNNIFLRILIASGEIQNDCNGNLVKTLLSIRNDYRLKLLVGDDLLETFRTVLVFSYFSFVSWCGNSNISRHIIKNVRTALEQFDFIIPCLKVAYVSLPLGFVVRRRNTWKDRTQNAVAKGVSHLENK